MNGQQLRRKRMAEDIPAHQRSGRCFKLLDQAADWFRLTAVSIAVL
jgi:hypothetical protein